MQQSTLTFSPFKIPTQPPAKRFYLRYGTFSVSSKKKQTVQGHACVDIFGIGFGGYIRIICFVCSKLNENGNSACVFWRMHVGAVWHGYTLIGESYNSYIWSVCVWMSRIVTLVCHTNSTLCCHGERDSFGHNKHNPSCVHFNVLDKFIVCIHGLSFSFKKCVMTHEWICFKSSHDWTDSNICVYWDFLKWRFTSWGWMI